MPAGGPRLDIVAHPATPLAKKCELPSDTRDEFYDRTRAFGRLSWTLLAPARRRAHPMRHLPALLQAR